MSSFMMKLDMNFKAFISVNAIADVVLTICHNSSHVAVNNLPSKVAAKAI